MDKKAKMSLTMIAALILVIATIVFMTVFYKDIWTKIVEWFIEPWIKK